MNTVGRSYGCRRDPVQPTRITVQNRRKSKTCQRENARHDLRGLQYEFGGHVNGRLEGAIHGTAFGKKAVDAAGGFVVLGSGLKLEPDMDAANDQNAVLSLYFSDCICNQPALAGGNPARLQRAPEGSGESTRGGGDDVIERRGVRLETVLLELVMPGDLAVDAKQDRIALGREKGPAQRTSHALDTDLRPVHHVGHGSMVAQVSV